MQTPLYIYVMIKRKGAGIMKRKKYFAVVFLGILCMTACGDQKGNLKKAENATVSTSQKETSEKKDKVEKTLDQEKDITEHDQVPKEELDNEIEAFFPTDWAGRYILEEKEDSIKVYCKKAYQAGEKDKSLLFYIYWITGDLVLPDYRDLGTYEGYPVEAVVPWDIPTFSSKEVTAEYTDMIYDVGRILDVIEDQLAEEAYSYQADQYDYESDYDLSLYTTPDASTFVTGVYQLDCSSWSESSKNEILGEYNHTSYLSISPDGTAYLSLGSKEPIQGTLLMVEDESALPEDEPECLIWFEDGIMKPGYYLQLCLTIHGMEEVELKQGAQEGLGGSVWTYNWVSDRFWTEETFRGDIG